MNRWAYDDPDSAMDWVMENPNAINESGQRSVLYAYARQQVSDKNGQTAFDDAAAIRDDGLRVRVYNAIASE